MLDTHHNMRPRASSDTDGKNADRWSFDAVPAAGAQRGEKRTKANHWEAVLVALMAAVVGSFVSATAYSQYRAATIDERARQIAKEISPAIEHLAAVRADVRRLQASATDYARAPEKERAMTLDSAKVSWNTFDDDVRRYASLRLGQRERDLWLRSIAPKLEEFRYSVRRIINEVHAGAADTAQRDSTSDLARAADGASSALVHAIELNASIAHDLAIRIARTRELSARVGWALDVLCTLSAGGAACLLVRAHRRHAALVSAHSRLLEQANQELEEFAGRVAHDISSPLTAIGLTLVTIERLKIEPPEVTRLVERGTRSVDKVRLIVDGLLEFARAAARPVAGARTEVKGAIDDVLATSASAAERNLVALASEPLPSCAVSCNPGVLTSLVSNLVENAIKYMGDSSMRRVTVRVQDRGLTVRVEVADTGPGIPADLAPQVFNPHVRGGNSKQPGIGLGLATVRRMAEAHGGEVGVETGLGLGLTFWFELPSAVAH